MTFLVLQSDFGIIDGAVSAMVGVALKVDPTLSIHHVTHEIKPYSPFEASYRLIQVIPYWPNECVFVSVVDPGVGTQRKSIVVKLKSGQLIVTPDNGSVTHLRELIDEVKIISKKHYHSHQSSTFHGRDLYAYIGAKLASGQLFFEEIGDNLEIDDLQFVPLIPVLVSDDKVIGNVDVLDSRFGSLWSSIDEKEFMTLGYEIGDFVKVSLYNSGQLVYQNEVLFGHSFSDVGIGSPVVYINSLKKVSIAINQGHFSQAYGIETGHQWEVVFQRD